MYTPQILTRRDKDGNAHYIGITRQTHDHGSYVGSIRNTDTTATASTPNGAADAAIKAHNESN